MGGVNGADEDGMGGAGCVSDDIEKVVDAVAEVNIGNSSFFKHDTCAVSLPVTIGMACLILCPFITFSFGDDPSCQHTIKGGKEGFTEKLLS